MDPSPSEAPAPAAAPYKRRRGNNKKPLPPRTERFDFPPATPEFFEEGGLRKVKPYMCVLSLALLLERGEEADQWVQVHVRLVCEGEVAGEDFD